MVHILSSFPIRLNSNHSPSPLPKGGREGAARQSRAGLRTHLLCVHPFPSKYRFFASS
ncbi:hypothetical protein TRL7639_00179 [Falsiruegeria litorea R37]|uniref:Uncharacterized protein n=1 Tax=Falsiruegeria litorea R37 TaxID=1200284 RepID=A0A1Y5RDS9_9RHOB|nr:hypothetical protein TRL7639_00179 [Falsiruegeria litorea R37]